MLLHRLQGRGCLTVARLHSRVMHTVFLLDHTRNISSDTSSVGYKHPLSETILEEISRIEPAWLKRDGVLWNHREGTLQLTFSCEVIDGMGSDDKPRVEKGVIVTVYDPSSRTHYLGVQFSKLVGRVSLTDNKKSAWQSNIFQDREHTITMVRELIENIDNARRGIFPEKST